MFYILGFILIVGSYFIPASKALSFNESPSRTKSLANSNVLFAVRLIKFSWDRYEYLTVLNKSIFSSLVNLFN